MADLLSALQGEIDRINEKRADEDKSEELSEILVESIHKTLRDIKLGASSTEFRDLTVLNFVVKADDAGYDPSAIKSYVKDLRSDPNKKR